MKVAASVVLSVILGLLGIGLAQAAGFFLLAGQALQLTGTPVTTGTVNVVYGFTVTASHGTPPYTYSQSGGPTLTGVSIDSSPTTGGKAFSGTPTVQGLYSGIVLTVTDHVGAKASLPAFNVLINPSASAGPVLVGGGGWLVGGDVNATDGQRLARTDTYGAYLWNSGTSSWSQLVTQSSMPAADFGFYPTTGTIQVDQRGTQGNLTGGGNGGGVYEIASCPSTSAKIYMMAYGKIFFSSNHGTTWTRTAFASAPLQTTAQTSGGNSTLTFGGGVPSWMTTGLLVTDTDNPSATPAANSIFVLSKTATTVNLTNPIPNGVNVASGDHITFSVPMGANSAYRMNGRKMAVDPNNCNHVYVGTDLNGMFETKDGGTTWSQVTAVPTAVADSGGNYPNYNIAFDPTSGTTGGLTNKVYAFAYQTSGAAVYASADAGTTWTATTGGPTTVEHMVVAPSGGTVWAVSGLSSGALMKYTGGTGGTWTTPLPSGDQIHSVAVDSVTGNVAAATFGGGIYLCTNGTCATSSDFSALTGTPTRAATDVPWLAVTNERSMSNGDQQYDPTGSNSLVFFEGIGVWTATPGANPVAYTSTTKGIEQMVSHSVIAPNGIPVVGVLDRSTFELPNYSTSYPTTTNNTYQNSYALNVTWGLDYAAGNTNFMAARIGDQNGFNSNNHGGNNNGTSTDGGATWTPFHDSTFGYVTITGDNTHVTDNGSGKVRLTVPSTTGLTSWTPGTSARSSIIRVIPFPANPNGPNTLRSFWEISLPAACPTTCIDLLGSSFSSSMQTGSYAVYVDTGPLSDQDKAYGVTGISNDSGLIKVTVNGNSSNNLGGIQLNQSIVCLSGVDAGTGANGCWTVTNVSSSTRSFDLFGSTFTATGAAGGSANIEIPQGGAVAVSDSNNILMVGSNQDYPVCTTDGGQTWTELQIPSGVAHGGTTGWVNAYFNTASPFAADRTQTGVFYAYNANSGQGIYTITNCVASGPDTQTVTNAVLNTKLLSVSDGVHNDLLLAIGPQGTPGTNHPTGGALRWRPNTGGAWTAMNHTQEPKAIGIGAIDASSDYPTVYYVGWNNQSGSYVYGIWRTYAHRSDWQNNTVTWTEVSDYPNGSMDGAAVMSGDLTSSTQWLVGFGGSSFAYGH